MRRVWCLVLTTAAYLTSAGIARAGDAPGVPVSSAVAVHRGRTCLDEPRLESHVRSWLRGDSVDPRVRVVVRGDDERPDVVTFSITRDGRSRTRRFDPAPAVCEEMHAAVALAVALAIDAKVLARVTRLAPPPRPLRLFVAQAGFAYHLLPGTSFGGRAGLEHEALDWLSATIDLQAQFSLDNEIAGTAGSFDAALFGGAARACAGGHLLKDLRVALCTGPAAGVVRAVGSRYAASASSTGAWAGLQTGFRLDLTLGLRWVLDAEMAVPLWSPSFRVERPDADAERDPKVAGLLVNLGPAFAF